MPVSLHKTIHQHFYNTQENKPITIYFITYIALTTIYTLYTFSTLVVPKETCFLQCLRNIVELGCKKRFLRFCSLSNIQIRICLYLRENQFHRFLIECLQCLLREIMSYMLLRVIRYQMSLSYSINSDAFELLFK